MVKVTNGIALLLRCRSPTNLRGKIDIKDCIGFICALKIFNNLKNIKKDDRNTEHQIKIRF